MGAQCDRCSVAFPLTLACCVHTALTHLFLFFCSHHGEDNCMTMVAMWNTFSQTHRHTRAPRSYENLLNSRCLCFYQFLLLRRELFVHLVYYYLSTTVCWFRNNCRSHAFPLFSISLLCFRFYCCRSFADLRFDTIVIVECTQIKRKTKSLFNWWQNNWMEKKKQAKIFPPPSDSFGLILSYVLVN